MKQPLRRFHLSGRQRNQFRVALLAVSALATLSAPLRVAAAESQTVDFIRNVMPVLNKAGCTGGICHGSFQGRGGFQLSLFGFDPAFDYEAIVQKSHSRRVFSSAPMQSLLLRKPLALAPHGGGKRLSTDDPAFQILNRWISDGAQPAADFKLHVESLRLNGNDVVLNPGSQANIRVEAVWSDGLVEDVTEWAIYEVRDETYATVSPAGVITPVNSGRTAVTIQFMGSVNSVTVTIPYDNPGQSVDFAANNFIDELVAKEWDKLNLRPAELSDDFEFCRRVHVDLVGRLPSPETVRKFVADTNPQKRSLIVDELLSSSQYNEYWSSRWADLLRVHRRYVGDKGLWSYWGWVKNAVRENWPVDRIVTELLTATGSLYTNGATAFYYIDEQPTDLAESASQLFLGVRLTCARCHHHPYEVWSQEDYYGLANAFTRIELKDNKDAARFGGTKILRSVSKPNKDRRVAMKVPPKALGHELQTDEDSDGDVRVELAAWITSPDNPYFAKNFTNRFWSYMMGRGLVEPVDDLRATNPASHPELLDRLATDFKEHGHDVKHLLRLICNSRVYQLRSAANPQVDIDGMFYTHRQFRRLQAAVFLDAINDVTETTTSFEGLPVGTRALSVPGPTVQSYFLYAGGGSVPITPCECATDQSPDLAQSLHLINSPHISAKISAGNGRIARLIKADGSDADIIQELYLATFGRPATDSELKTAERFVKNDKSRQENFEDLLWTLMNSTEFVFNH